MASTSGARRGPPKYRCHGALPNVGAVCYLRNARVCAGGGSYPQTFVGTANFESGRSPSTHWSFLCSRAAWVRRPDFTASAPTWLTVPRARGLVLICEQQPYGRASNRKLERLRRAAPLCDLSVHLVSLVVLAARAYAERCREHPRSGSSVRWSEPDFAELLWLSES